jgi:hypothetical protein
MALIVGESLLGHNRDCGRLTYSCLDRQEGGCINVV